MAATKYPNNLEIQLNQPIDTRFVCDNLSDLTDYLYIGLQTYCKADGKSYELVSFDDNGQPVWKWKINSNIQTITYAELVSLRNNSELIPGMQYQIIDYTTTTNTSVANSSVVGNNFDIIIEAIDSNTLSENAKVCTCAVENRNCGEYQSNLFSWPAMSNWWNKDASSATVNVNNLPQSILQLFSENTLGTLLYQQGTRACEAGKTIRVKLTEGTNIFKPVGAAISAENTPFNYIAVDSGVGRTEFYLHIPSDFVFDANEKVIIRLFGIGDVNAVNAANSYGAVADKMSGVDQFESGRIHTWDVRYCLDNDSNRFNWATSNGKGVIYYMKDEFDNEAFYDFKNIKFNGLYTFDYEIGGIHYDGSLKYGNVCYGNKIGSDILKDQNSKISLAKIVFKNTTATAQCHCNIIGNDCWNISFGNGCYHNEIQEGCENIQFGNNCHNNTLMSSCKGINTNIIFGNGCYSNTFGLECTNNIFGNDCANNTFENGSSNNTFGDACSNNIFGTDCNQNTFGDYCTANTFGDNCCDNLIGNKCCLNTFGTDCNQNILGCDSSWEYSPTITDTVVIDGLMHERSNSYNKFGNNCVNNKLGYNCTYNDFNENCKNNKILSNCLGNKFETYCSENTLGDNCQNNTFNQYCNSNVLSIQCSYNIFETYCNNNKLSDFCQSNTFKVSAGGVVGSSADGNILGSYTIRCTFGKQCKACQTPNYSRMIEFGDQCQGVKFIDGATGAGPSNYLQNYKVDNNWMGNVTIDDTIHPKRSRLFETRCSKDSYGRSLTYCVADSINQIALTHGELIALKNNSQLTPGTQYRITDYVTTTTQEGTKAANNQFDIIVTADDVNVLSHLARAAKHEGVNYFDSCDIEAWQLWYNIDNDTTKYAWVDENSKGVIYRMIDDKGNDCPYDFKNILFYTDKYTDNITSDNYYYTFSYVVNNVLYDGTVESRVQDCYNNSMKGNFSQSPQQQLQSLNGNIFRIVGFEYYCYENTFGKNCYGNTFEKNCYGNTFGKDCYSNNFGSNCFFNTFKDYCSDNTFGNVCFSNTFEDNCGGNTFGSSCYSNTFGEYCLGNTFEDTCCYNSFGNNCESNAFGEECTRNSFGAGCHDNNFGRKCGRNIFGNGCYGNTFGNTCQANSFGMSCYENSFGIGSSDNSFGNNCYYNTFENSCESNIFGAGCHTNSLGSSYANIFGDDCYENTLESGCYSNTFGNGCYGNYFEYDCGSNTFGDGCQYNTFGNNCNSNTFGNYCHINTFGNYCQYNTFGDDCGSNTFGFNENNLKSYYRYIVFDKGNKNINLYCTGTTSSSNYYQNVRIGLGVNNTSTSKTIHTSNVGQTYETHYKPANSQTILV